MGLTRPCLISSVLASQISSPLLSPTQSLSSSHTGHLSAPQHARIIPASGPLHLLFSLPGMPSLQISLWLAPSYPSHFLLREAVSDNLIQKKLLPTHSILPSCFTSLGICHNLQSSCLFICSLIYFFLPHWPWLALWGQGPCLSCKAGSPVARHWAWYGVDTQQILVQ